jgi:hypothetical protein
MQQKKLTVLILLIFLCSVLLAEEAEIEYLFPLPDSKLHAPETIIIIRFRNRVTSQPKDLDLYIKITGDDNRQITFRTVVSTDQKTIIVQALQPFKAGEQVNVSLLSPKTHESKVLSSFKIATGTELPERKIKKRSHKKNLHALTPYNVNKTTGRDPRVYNGVSVPSDFPEFEISINDNPDQGSIFLTTIRDNAYAIILDNQANPLFYWRSPAEMMSFKAQPDNRLSLLVWEGEGQLCGPLAFDSTFSIVDTFCPPPGYWFDEHELVLLENGHYLLIACDERVVDMSKIVEGGQKNAILRGNHVVEMDASDNPVIIWRSWDHFEITDTEHQEMDAEYIDLQHINSIDVDLDGNWVISSRHLSEVTKINRQTGTIMWRLGGRNDYFTWINDAHRISYQHDARVLPNGNYTIFDNGNFHDPEFSRSLEVQLDTVNWTATKVWEFRDSPDKYAEAEGNTQRLSNGNMLINWSGWEQPCLTEVRPDGSKAFEMWVEAGTYRTTRSYWQGKSRIPYLIAEAFADRNKFGDTDITKYNIYGGLQPHPEQIIASTTKSFIHLTELTNDATYYFRATAVNGNRQESGFSNEEEIYVDITPPGTNIVENGDFSQRLQGWQFNISDANATWSITNGGELKLVIFDGGDDFDQVQALYKDIVLINGSTYLFEFDAFAHQNRVLEAELKKENTPSMNYSKMGLIGLKTTKRHYSHRFTMEEPTQTSVELCFNAGASNHDVYIDNVSLKQVITDINEKTQENPLFYALGTNYPNPFNSTTHIRFTLPTREHVILNVYTILGRKVRTLVNGTLPAGSHEVTFHAEHLSSGLYLYRLKTKWFQKAMKMLYIK